MSFGNNLWLNLWPTSLIFYFGEQALNSGESTVFSSTFDWHNLRIQPSPCTPAACRVRSAERRLYSQATIDGIAVILWVEFSLFLVPAPMALLRYIRFSSSSIPPKCTLPKFQVNMALVRVKMLHWFHDNSCLFQLINWFPICLESDTCFCAFFNDRIVNDARIIFVTFKLIDYISSLCRRFRFMKQTFLSLVFHQRRSGYFVLVIILIVLCWGDEEDLPNNTIQKKYGIPVHWLNTILQNKESYFTVMVPL